MIILIRIKNLRFFLKNITKQYISTIFKILCILYSHIIIQKAIVNATMKDTNII